MGNFAQNKISQCSDFNKRWYDLKFDSVFTKPFKPSTKKVKNVLKYIVPIYFYNKGLMFIHFNSILCDNSSIHHLPQPPQENEIPSIVYNLSNTIQNKIFNYQDTVNSIIIILTLFELTVCYYHVTYAFYNFKFSDFVPVLSKEFLDIQATIECELTLKCVREMIITYGQMHHT